MKSTIKENLDQFVRSLQQAAGDNLECLALYGSAARSDFNEHYSDVNLVLILRQTNVAALGAIADVLSWWTHEQHQSPPLITTADELNSSADVFAIETLDLVANHRVLAGADVISSVPVPMDLHRVQVERELRTVLLKLRQHYVLSRGNERELHAAIARSSSSVTTLFRHALIALGRTAPHSRRDIVAEIAQLQGVDAAPLQTALDLREGRRPEVGIDSLYQRYMDSITALLRVIDQLSPRLTSSSQAPSQERTR